MMILIYNNEGNCFLKKEELDLINEGLKKNLNKKIKEMKLLYKASWMVIHLKIFINIVIIFQIL